MEGLAAGCGRFSGRKVEGLAAGKFYNSIMYIFYTGFSCQGGRFSGGIGKKVEGLRAGCGRFKGGIAKKVEGLAAVLLRVEGLRAS